MADLPYNPLVQRCYTCGRESPAWPLLHYFGCEVGTYKPTTAADNALSPCVQTSIPVTTPATPDGVKE